MRITMIKAYAFSVTHGLDKLISALIPASVIYLVEGYHVQPWLHVMQFP